MRPTSYHKDCVRYWLTEATGQDKVFMVTSRPKSKVFSSQIILKKDLLIPCKDNSQHSDTQFHWPLYSTKFDCKRPFEINSLWDTLEETSIGVQLNLFITVTQGRSKKRPLWVGGLYIEVRSSADHFNYFFYTKHFLFGRQFQKAF